VIESLIGVIVLLILLVLGMPIAVSLLVGGVVGILFFSGYSVMDATSGILAYAKMASSDLSVIPLFILIGALAAAAGISASAYEVANRWLGRLPGGLGITSIAACAAFAATSGSTVATAATVGKIAIPEMRDYGYSPSFAAGIVAAGGLLGIMIPPSIALVLYGIITEQSIGKLLMAGLLPGILTALIFMLAIFALAKLKPSLAPRGRAFTWRERFSSLPKMWGVFLLFFIIMGGIYGGIFIAMEAAAVGAFAAFLILFILKRRSFIKYITEAFWETSSTTAMIFFVLLGAAFFGIYINMTGFVDQLSTAIVSAQLSPYVVLLMLTFGYILLGMFLDGISIMLITMPVVFQPMVNLGFDPIWFGVYIVIMIEVANITPPVGFNVYVIKGVAPDIPIEGIFKSVSIFVVLELVTLVVLTAFPQIATWLPSQMIGR